MMSSTPMKQVVAIVLESDVDAITRVLLDEGVMHFINLRSLSAEISESLISFASADATESATSLRKRVGQMLDTASISTPVELDISKLRFIGDGTASVQVAKIEDAVTRLRRQQDEVRGELKQLVDISRQVDLFGDFSGGLPANSRFSYLDVHTGAIPADKIPLFSDAIAKMPAVSALIREHSGRGFYFVIGMKRDEKRMAAVLDAHGWEDLDLGEELPDAGAGVHSSIDTRIEAVEEKSSDLADEIKKIILENEALLVDLWSNLRMNELYGQVQSFYSRTSRTVVFTGWVPAKSGPDLDRRIREVATQGCYLEWHRPELSNTEEVTEVPVELKNPKFLKPFEMLVQNFAVPAYGTIDPTPLVAVAYLAMFGLMFGDAGHGLVLLLSGLISRLLYRKQNKVRDILTLLVYCGGASIISGTLFGSYFGFQLFKPIWFDFHGIVAGHSGGPLVSTIYDVLGITIYFGITVIGLGLLLNWVNLVRRRNWFPLIFDKAGLLGGFIYGAGIWATRLFVASGYRTLPDGKLLFLFLGIPVLLLGAKAPLHHFLHPKAKMHPMLIVDFIMDWIVEVLEVFSGYLANTLSFMRVAGLGIAHEALLIAFFQIARMAGGGSLSSVGAILILIIGNVLIVGLEGLSAGIQSLRLNYYEFFSKYFTGAGRAYAPVSLQNSEWRIK